MQGYLSATMYRLHRVREEAVEDLSTAAMFTCIDAQVNGHIGNKEAHIS